MFPRANENFKKNQNGQDIYHKVYLRGIHKEPSFGGARRCSFITEFH